MIFFNYVIMESALLMYAHIVVDTYLLYYLLFKQYIHLETVMDYISFSILYLSFKKHVEEKYVYSIDEG